MTAYDRVLAALDAAGQHRKSMGEHSVQAQCPAHEDRQPSLCISIGEKGVVLKCMAGCETPDVVAALGLKMSDLFDEPSSNGNGDRAIVATYSYVDEVGELLYEVVRFSPKDFRQRRPDGKGGWSWKLGDVRRVPYKLPQLIAAVKDGRPVYILEGEKDCDALEAWEAASKDSGKSSIAATCNAGGAGKWKSSYNEFFKEARVTIVADRDDPGRKHAAEVADALQGVAAVVEMKEAAVGKDLADHLAAGHGLGELRPVSVTPTDSVTAETAAVSQSNGSNACNAPAEGVGEETPAEADLLPAAALLERVEKVLRRYIVLPSDAARDALALFVLHTWAIEGAHATPYMLVISPEKGSGKSRLLEVLELLVRAPWPCLSASEAALFRRIERDTPTLLLDEIDAIFKSSTEATEPIRAVLNGGNRRGACASRCVGKGTDMQVVDFSIYCAKVLAGIDTGHVPETVVDRSVVIHMQRRRPDERVERLRMRLVEQRVQKLRAELERWAQEHVERLAAADPSLPDDLSDRQADAWEPLLAIADTAADGWPERARKAAHVLSDRETAASRGTMLLAAIRDALGDAPAIFTTNILEEINNDDELPFGGWSDGKGLDARGLSKLLKPYGLGPTTVRQSEKVAKGYKRADLAEAFARYLPPPGAALQPSQRLQPALQSQESVTADVSCNGHGTVTLAEQAIAKFGKNGERA